MSTVALATFSLNSKVIWHATAESVYPPIFDDKMQLIDDDQDIDEDLSYSEDSYTPSVVSSSYSDPFPQEDHSQEEVLYKPTQEQTDPSLSYWGSYSTDPYTSYNYYSPTPAYDVHPSFSTAFHPSWQIPTGVFRAAQNISKQNKTN